MSLYWAHLTAYLTQKYCCICSNCDGLGLYEEIQIIFGTVSLFTSPLYPLYLFYNTHYTCNDHYTKNGRLIQRQRSKPTWRTSKLGRSLYQADHAEASLRVPDFIISVCSSSCNYLFHYFFLSFSIDFLASHPAVGMPKQSIPSAVVHRNCHIWAY